MCPISFNPKDATKGGGLADDFDGEITGARIDLFTYPNSGKTSVGLILDITTEDEDELEQFYSIGPESAWSPSDDNTSVIGNSGQQSIADNCNANLFFAHLVDADFPAEKLENDDVTILEGLKGHFKHVPQPKRAGLSGGGGDREKTILTVSEIYSTKFDKKGKGKKSGKSKSSGKSSSGNGDDYDDDAAALVMEVLSEKGTAAKKELMQAAFKTIKGNLKKRKAVVLLVNDDDFLGDDNQPWEYDASDGTVSG